MACLRGFALSGLGLLADPFQAVRFLDLYPLRDSLCCGSTEMARRGCVVPRLGTVIRSDRALLGFTDERRGPQMVIAGRITPQPLMPVFASLYDS